MDLGLGLFTTEAQRTQRRIAYIKIQLKGQNAKFNTPKSPQPPFAKGERGGISFQKGQGGFSGADPVIRVYELRKGNLRVLCASVVNKYLMQAEETRKPEGEGWNVGNDHERNDESQDEGNGGPGNPFHGDFG